MVQIFFSFYLNIFSSRCERFTLSRGEGGAAELEAWLGGLRAGPGAEVVVVDNLHLAPSLDTLLQDLATLGTQATYIIGECHKRISAEDCHQECSLCDTTQLIGC